MCEGFDRQISVHNTRFIRSEMILILLTDVKKKTGFSKHTHKFKKKLHLSMRFNAFFRRTATSIMEYPWQETTVSILIFY